MKILIEGIGGIGGIVSASLISEGYDITLITANQSITDAINNEGIRITNSKNEGIYKATAYTSLDNLTDKISFDYIFLIMKANQVKEAAMASVDLLSENGVLVTFQNGIVEFEIEKIIGKGKVIPVTVGFGGTMLKPGVYEKTSPGGFHTGELHGGISDRILELSEILDNVDDVKQSDNMIGILWSKLAINCSINSLGAISGQKFGELLSNKENRSLLLQIYQEVVDTAHAQDIELETVAANPYLLYLPKSAGWLNRVFRDIMVRIVARKYKDTKSSTLQSIERGRESEVDMLNGYIVQQAEKEGIDVPANNAVTKIMKKIDNGELKPHPDTVDLVFELLQ